MARANLGRGSDLVALSGALWTLFARCGSRYRRLVPDRHSGERAIRTMSGKTKDESAEKEATRKARASRIRAARAFADFDQAAIAHLLGVSVITVKRMERGTRDISLDELHKIADYCGIPRAFMESGFSKDGERERQAEMVTTFMDALDQRFDALSEALLSRDEALAISRTALERLRAPRGRVADS